MLKFVASTLRHRGYEVQTARDGVEALELLRRWSRVPVVVLSAHGQEEEMVRALDLGADDYLTKPFGVPELLARVRVALRHARDAGGGEEVGWRWTTDRGDGLRLDAVRRLVHRSVAGAEQEVRLTPTE